MKREGNCVIIISQIAIDCKNKRFTMIYDSVSEAKCAGQRSGGVGILKREVLADRGEEIDLREGGRECTQFRRLQDYKGI